MSKVLVSVYVPAVTRSFDVYIPYEIKLHVVADVLRGLFSSEQAFGGKSVARGVLCDRVTGEPLDVNKSAQELELQNGSRIMVI